MELIESKSLLAKLMATENLTVEQKNVQTASFDVQNRILTIPVLDKMISSELYDLFTGHEVGHALYTPLEGMKKAKEMNVNMSIANVVEDSRIERLIKDKYPGLRNSFYKAYNELMQKNFFGTSGKNLNNMNFIDRLNIHCKGGSIGCIRFTEKESELVKMVESTKNYDDVITVTNLIVKYMKEEHKENQKKHYYTLTEDDEYDKLFGIESEEGEEEFFLKEDDEFEGSDDWDDSAELETPVDAGSNEYAEEEIQDSDLVCKTQEIYDNNQYKLFSKESLEYVYMNIPEVNCKDVVVDYKAFYDAAEKYYSASDYWKDKGYLENGRKSYLLMRNELAKVVSYLVKEFEMRKNAAQLKRASIAKTGDLDMNRIFSYKFNEDIFKKATIVPGGKSHGLVLFLDWSGSMTQHIGQTFKQLLSLVLFCKKVNIPYEVYAFADENIWCKTGTLPKDGDYALNPFSLVNILSSRMSAREFTDAISTMLHLASIRSYFFKMHGTPLNETICAAMELVAEFKKSRKLQVVNTVFLTDGDSNFYLNQHVLRPMENRFIKKELNTYNKYNIVLRDPKTKNEVYVDASNMSVSFTSALFSLFKKRLRQNTLGFYILRSNKEMLNKINRMNGTYLSFGDAEKYKSDFTKNKSLIIKNVGFDEYYLLKMDNTDTSDEDFVVSERATTRGIVSAFSKYTKNRLSNKIVLNRFIGMIS